MKMYSIKIFVSSFNLISIQKVKQQILVGRQQKSVFVVLPNKNKKFIFLKSPHVNSKAKEAFYLREYNRYIKINISFKDLVSLLRLLPNDICCKVIFSENDAAR
tara:strand:- start:173 stop:484 length:312 start_codon:yes stop_codon:yes gene_type:complete